MSLDFLPASPFKILFRLEEEYIETEYQIRAMMAKPDALKSSHDRGKEERLIERLMAIVDERNEIVNCIEMDRVRALEEDDAIETHMEEYAAVKPGPDAEDEAKTKKKKKKKEKKKKRRDKGYDADKDIDTKEYPAGASSSSKPSSPVKKRLTLSPALVASASSLTDKEKLKKAKKKIMSTLKPVSKKKDPNA